MLRLTTDVSITAVLEEKRFFLDDTVTLILGPDESVQGAVAETGRRFLDRPRTTGANGCAISRSPSSGRTP